MGKHVFLVQSIFATWSFRFRSLRIFACVVSDWLIKIMRFRAAPPKVWVVFYKAPTANARDDQSNNSNRQKAARQFQHRAIVLKQRIGARQRKQNGKHTRKHGKQLDQRCFRMTGRAQPGHHKIDHNGQNDQKDDQRKRLKQTN